jgi:hypothetical protein
MYILSNTHIVTVIIAMGMRLAACVSCNAYAVHENYVLVGTFSLERCEWERN